MIKFFEYIARLNKFLDNSKKIIVDIEETSSSIYFVETLYRDDIHKHTSDYRYSTANFKSWTGIEKWANELKSKNNEIANRLLFWKITKYDDVQKLGFWKSKEFTLILDNEYNIIDISFERRFLRKNDICPEIKPLIVEWIDLDMLTYKDEICEYPFKNGDIVMLDIPWLSEKSMYIFHEIVKEQRENWFIDMNCSNIIGGKNIDIQRINDSNFRIDIFAYVGYLRKVNFNECSDARIKMGADLVKNDSDFMIFLDKMSKTDKFEPEQKEKLSEQAERYIYETYRYDLCKNRIICNETQANVVLSQEELKNKIGDILERTRKTIFIDCDESEIYNVKMKLRKDADDLTEYEKRKGNGIFKKYSDVNALILNYPYRLCWGTAQIDETVREYMYFEVEKYILNSNNRYVCICRMIFTAIDGILVDVEFSENIKRYYDDVNILTLYNDWLELKCDVEKSRIKTFLPKYGDVLKIDLRPMHDVTEFVYLGNEKTNELYGILKISEKNYEITHITNKLYTGMGTAGAWAFAFKDTPKDNLLEKLSDALKKNPKCGECLSELEDEEEYFRIHEEDLEEFLAGCEG